MKYNHDKVDKTTLALLYLNMWEEESVSRAWKGFDWDTLDRLHKKGLIHDPKGKAKSIIITPEGKRMSEELFHKFFEKENVDKIFWK